MSNKRTLLILCARIGYKPLSAAGRGPFAALPGIPLPRNPAEHAHEHAHEPHNLTKHWQALDAAHHVHPFSETAALNTEGVRVITKADGVYLWDSEGKKLIDGMSGLWCVQVGYGNGELAEAGCEALKTLPYYNHFFKTSNP